MNVPKFTASKNFTEFSPKLVQKLTDRLQKKKILISNFVL